jgi:AcrR family transcriptional regulator
MTTAAESGNRAPSPPRLRRDAQRNRDAIVAAARQLFCDQGLEAPLDEIARRAGVGIATLYRRFPSRVELLDAVLADTLQAHIEVAEQALAMDDPWEGFAFYLEETCRLQASDRGQNDAMGMRFPAPPPWRRLGDACSTWAPADRPHPGGRPAPRATSLTRTWPL